MEQAKRREEDEGRVGERRFHTRVRAISRTEREEGGGRQRKGRGGTRKRENTFEPGSGRRQCTARYVIRSFFGLRRKAKRRKPRGAEGGGLEEPTSLTAITHEGAESDVVVT